MYDCMTDSLSLIILYLYDGVCVTVLHMCILTLPLSYFVYM